MLQAPGSAAVGYDPLFLTGMGGKRAHIARWPMGAQFTEYTRVWRKFALGWRATFSVTKLQGCLGCTAPYGRSG